VNLDAMLALNQAHEKETSVLDAKALKELVDQASHLPLRAEGRDGFLIALDQDAVYASVNFAWFKAKFPRFVYVDRIIVAESARGQGLARSMYEELFAAARAQGYEQVCAEVNKLPPNPASDAFHAALGFEVIGEAELANGKTVRYFRRAL
jgi:predicted GNAT superfamily acetyltransferase